MVCKNCSKIDLQIDKFLIRSRVMPTKSSYMRESLPSIFSPRSANNSYALGTYEEISSRKDVCRFCGLVSQSVTESEEVDSSCMTAEQLNAVCYLTWEIDGRSARKDQSTVKARTRRIHVQWRDGIFEDTYLVLVTPVQFKLISSDARHIWQPESHFLGRRILSDASRATLIKSWLDECLNNHKKCLHSLEDRRALQEVTKQSYFGVVDVEQMCLTALPQKTSTHLKTYKFEYDVNSLDTERDKREPYVALSYVWGGKNTETTVNTNLLGRLFPGGLEEPLKRMPKIIRDFIELVRRLGYRYLWIDSLCIVQDSKSSWKLNAEVMDSIYGNADLKICAADGKDATVGLRALSKPSNSQVIIECAPEGRVFFQCRSSTMSEDLVQSSLKLLGELSCRPIWFYMSCIPLYSSRNLSSPDDVIAAFNGVSNRIEEALNSPMIFALPSSHFDLAMLWVPLQASKRRGSNSEFPSWSWCGWEGATIDYLTNSMIDDCLGDIRHWLECHTWIRWYIRDGRGRLRPVWDSNLALRDRRSNLKWQGYKSEREPRVTIIRYSPDDQVNTNENRHSYGPEKISSYPHTYEGSDGDGRREARVYDRGEHRVLVEREHRTRERGATFANDPIMVSQVRGRSSDSFSTSTSRGEQVHHALNPVSIRDTAPGARNSYSRPEERYSHREHVRRSSMAPPPPRPRPSPPPPMPLGEDRFLPRDAYQQNPENTSVPDIDHTDHRNSRDLYSRCTPSHVPDKDNRFSRTIPESPYTVNMAEFTPEKETEYPESPILQFWTHSAIFRLCPQTLDYRDSPNNGLHRFNVADASGD
ncbi:uncharacterized protein K452DRAFT_333354 [Aplosporella prunicola CBS 121167]|uniref:Heterokaryon incompatibility domain-containing protein n=1 Tax=Aplosporella prunicola CBS 121167 TaxID=1176127 RepID=A0A6A6BEB2_9PEZI|nr:uncharacterized protein K452DRAFT_333354 [Aplosporella prunicola CBS 121167]KAF2141614.1 hypothetical protein K452DRAFT_333354 [Aplosporella prunicola CBS 121167]